MATYYPSQTVEYSQKMEHSSVASSTVIPMSATTGATNGQSSYFQYGRSTFPSSTTPGNNQSSMPHSASFHTSPVPSPPPTLGPRSPTGSVCSMDSFVSGGRGLSRRSRPASSGGGAYFTPRTLSANQKGMKYLRRLVHFRHMDFEYALWQMWYLLTSPQKVYRNFQHRKQTRDQFARDDPAFLVLLALCLVVTSIGFSLALHFGVSHTVKFVLWVVFVDCIGVGVLMATLLWLLANHLFRTTPSNRGAAVGNGVEMEEVDVEWAYAFDIHLNAFFPLLIILHAVQLPFLSIILNDWFISRLLGNTFWLVAVGYYIYITFLGFSCLRFLKKAEFLLYSVTVCGIVYLVSVVVGLNFSQILCDFYKYRVK